MITIKLTGDLEKFVKLKVKEGFRSPDAVIEDALRHWIHTDAMERDPKYVAYVRRALAEAEEDLEKGRYEIFDKEAFLKKAHEEHAQRTRK